MKDAGRSLCGMAFLALVAAAILLLHEPPTPLPADAPPARFAAGRAMADVEAIAAEPHPPGSPAHARVRDHIVSRLVEVGLDARVERAVARNLGRDGRYRLANVENIVATRPGTAPGGTLVLAAHYDSRVSGPGAGDDAAAVAALIEAVRALGDAPARNTLTVLVTDAEECGLLGARAWADALGDDERQGMVVLNFEARGGGGPVFMFETSDGNEALVREFAAAAPRPHASSLMVSLYESLPNDTDLSVFKQRGLAGLNFAFVGGLRHYHTALDTPANLDPRAVQHHGESALALARRLLGADLALLARPSPRDGIYFDLAGRFLVGYPMALVWPLTILAVAAWMALVWRAVREPEGLSRFAIGAAAAAATVAASAAVVFWIGGRIHVRDFPAPNGDPCGAPFFEGSLLAAALATSLGGWWLLSEKVADRAGILGALGWWVLLLVAASARLPGGTYLLLWPLVAALVGLLPRGAIPSGVVVLLFVAPFWHSLSLLVAFENSGALGALAALAFIPLLPALEALRVPRSPATAGVAGAVAAAAFAVGFTMDDPRLSTLSYVADLDAGRTFWCSTLPADAWTEPLLRDAVAERPGTWRPMLTAPAPPAPLPEFTARREDGLLVIDLPPDALELHVDADAPLEGLAIDGAPLPKTTSLVWFAPPRRVEISLPASAPSLRLEASIIGLPESAPPRPDGFIAAPWGTETDCTLLRRTVQREP